MHLLHLETATKICSVALSENGILLHEINYNDDSFSHGEKLTLLIDKVLEKAQISIEQLAGVSVSAGPGSYTGLRIGVSTAKGICFALNIPLISVSTLESYIEIAKERFPNQTICAMIDARRMEVFSLIKSSQNQIIKKESADVLDANSYHEFGQLLVIGDANAKMKTPWKGRNVFFNDEIQLSAKGQVQDAYKKYQEQNFVDLAYFEPNYIKPFYTGK